MRQSLLRLISQSSVNTLVNDCAWHFVRSRTEAWSVPHYAFLFDASRVSAAQRSSVVSRRAAVVCDVRSEVVAVAQLATPHRRASRSKKRTSWARPHEQVAPQHGTAQILVLGGYPWENPGGPPLGRETPGATMGHIPGKPGNTPWGFSSSLVESGRKKSSLNEFK